MITAYGEEAVPAPQEKVVKKAKSVKSKIAAATHNKKAKKQAHEVINEHTKNKKIKKHISEKIEEHNKHKKVEKKTHNEKKVLRMKAPTVHVKHQSKGQHLLHQIRTPRRKDTERQLKARVANTRVNKATPIGQKFDRGTIFNPKKPTNIGI